ncbi:FecR protein [Aeoliella mucimassa]|uniref:FecR protein n=2 Tax=Aeoliella mucimassa TaxID=2527972 RepID=A0A518AGQ7_9BACT|nr:FecR protein [Aeoliella mucimassa]
MPDHQELEMLLAMVVLGEATEEQLAQLNQLLLADAAAREFTCDYLAGEAVLQRHFQLVDRVALLHGTAHETHVATKQESGTTGRTELRAPHARSQSFGHHRLWWVAGLAACLLIGIAIANRDQLASLWIQQNAATANANLPERVGTLLAGATPRESLVEALQQGRPIRVGDTIDTNQEITYLHFDCGAEVLLVGPTQLSVVSPMRAKLLQGTLTARVSESAHGFRVDTPNSKVTDLGTEFGVSVAESGVTDTVVFSGKVAMEYREIPTEHEVKSEIALRRPSQSHLLTEGIALRVTEDGLAERIVSVTRSDYPLPGAALALKPDAAPVIRDVWDNLSTRDTSKAYQIVHGGFVEDAPAFVDRKYQWNGISETYGLPKMLRGGDYIMPFCDDKYQDRIEVTVDLVQPARLFVLMDNRLSVPEWLSSRFTDTGYDVGIDEDDFSVERSWQKLDKGPGVSLERSCSVWYIDVPEPQPVVLGALDPPIHWRVMYGIVAVPLETAMAIAPEPAMHHQPKIGSGLIHPGVLPEPVADCEIERALKVEQLTLGKPSDDDFAAAKRGLVFRAETLGGQFMPHPDTLMLENNVAPALNDGLTARNYDDLERNFWYNGQGRFSLDLQRPTKLQSIHTYSTHWLDRSFQNFTVWGARSEAMPAVDFETATDAEGWELVGIVNTDVLDPGGIHASILTAGESGMGPYRHLLWIIESTDRSTFFSEIDVYEHQE